MRTDRLESDPMERIDFNLQEKSVENKKLNFLARLYSSDKRDIFFFGEDAVYDERKNFKQYHEVKHVCIDGEILTIEANYTVIKCRVDKISPNMLVSHRNAAFSSDMNHRYTLWDWWDTSKEYAMFIGLNPSTADEIKNDPTVTRCINFSKRWGYGGFCMTNMFSYRATDPKEMKSQPEWELNHLTNKFALKDISRKAGIVVACWGSHGEHLDGDSKVRRLIKKPMFCLGKTKKGLPRHPLYIKSNKQLEGL